MKFNRSTRRMFLQGTGGALVSIPFLTSLLPKESWAQAANNPIKRFITIRSAHEMGHHSYWLPNTNGQIFNLVQPTQIQAGINGHHNVRWQLLRDFAPTNGSVLAPYYGSGLSPYLESTNILRGLDFIVRYGHAGANTLGGLVIDDSGALEKIQTIDHVINGNKLFNPGNRPVAIIGGHSGDVSQILSANGTVINASNLNYDFGRIYNGLFSNGNYPESGQQAATNPKSNVLNRVLEDYNRLKNSKNISAADKQILQNAFDKLSDVQNSFSVMSTATCGYKNFFTTHPGVTVHSNTSAVDSTLNQKALADLITAAIICDTNRVFNICLGAYFGVLDGFGFDHQVTSHEPFGVVGGIPNWQRMGDRQKILFTNFTLPLIQNLSAAIDPSNGKSYLYNSLIYNTMESSQVHGWGSHPVMLFGNAGGNITSGKYIDYSDRSKGVASGVDTGTGNAFNKTVGNPQFGNNYFGASYNRLLVTIMQGMGLTPADYENNSLNSQLHSKTAIANVDIGSYNHNLSNIGGFGYAYPIDINLNTYGRNSSLGNIKNYDLRQFKYKLPIL